MSSNPKYDIQTSGTLHVWRNPSNNFKHAFLRIDFRCNLDPRPGIVIITNENYQHAFASAVKNLQRELPALLNQIQGNPVAYWWLEQNKNEIERILSGITEHPVFADIR
jgi:hypothetical protein